MDPDGARCSSRADSEAGRGPRSKQTDSMRGRTRMFSFNSTRCKIVEEKKQKVEFIPLQSFEALHINFSSIHKNDSPLQQRPGHEAAAIDSTKQDGAELRWKMNANQQTK